MTTRVLLILAVAASVACGVKADGPPEIQVDRTACSHCGMLVSEPVYAAAYRAPDSDPRVFDDIRCLLEAAQKEPNTGSLRFWFHDAASLLPQDGPLATPGRPTAGLLPQDGPLATPGRPTAGLLPQDGPLAAPGRPTAGLLPQDGPLAATGRPRGEEWIGGDALFVSSPTLRTPMGGGLIAYRDRTAALEAAARHHGSVVDSVGDLLRSSNLGGTRASQAR